MLAPQELPARIDAAAVADIQLAELHRAQSSLRGQRLRFQQLRVFLQALERGFAFFSVARRKVDEEGAVV